MISAAVKIFWMSILFTCACSPRHYHSCWFIHNPSFDQFGASLEKSESFWMITSYIRSEMKFRTEYIYENFDMTFPHNYKVNKKYDITTAGMSIYFAKGDVEC